ncbi:MAG: hypothetical protein CV090_05275 [Nitrospira sp. WS238]|nr:hypothetical protein [Nitrospira sp. WS238]
MRHKIPCSAERLSLLDPQMIQAVSDASAFQFSQQYVTENRVRIVEADDAQITATVIGNSGLYEQAIRLKDGHLVSKCSCTLHEEPMCRHCIAILLEYHRWANPKQSRKPSPSKESTAPAHVVPSVNGKASVRESTVTDVKLRDVLQFMEWLPSATKSVQTQGQLPDPPQFDSTEVSSWIRSISHLVESRRESDQAAVRLKAELRDRETHVRRLTQELQTSMDDAKTAQARSEELRLEVEVQNEKLARVAELATSIVTYEAQLRVAASDLLQKGSQFDKLASAIKDMAQALQAAVKPTDPS